MKMLTKLRSTALAAVLTAVSLPAGAATIGTSYTLAFTDEDLGAGLGGNGFTLSDHLTATITQTDVDTATFDFQFLSDGFGFAGFYLELGTTLDSFLGGELVQDDVNVRSIFGDRNIPRGISFGSSGSDFGAGDLLSVVVSADGLDIDDWSTFLHRGNASGNYGGISYSLGQGSVAIFGVTGNGAPVIAAVPLPAGGVLLIAGLGALVVLRRRGAQA